MQRKVIGHTKCRNFLRIGADERAEEESGGDPILGDLVGDFTGQILPQPWHHLLLERRQGVCHRLHLHRYLPHSLFLFLSQFAEQLGSRLSESRGKIYWKILLMIRTLWTFNGVLLFLVFIGFWRLLTSKILFKYSPLLIN